MDHANFCCVLFRNKEKQNDCPKDVYSRNGKTVERQRAAMCLRVMRLWVSELQVKQASLNVIKTFVRLR